MDQNEKFDSAPDIEFAQLKFTCKTTTAVIMVSLSGNRLILYTKEDLHKDIH